MAFGIEMRMARENKRGENLVSGRKN